MYKNLSGKYYEDNKERLEKEFVKDTQEKKDNMVVEDTKISQKTKNKSCLRMEQHNIK